MKKQFSRFLAVLLAAFMVFQSMNLGAIKVLADEDEVNPMSLEDPSNEETPSIEYVTYVFKVDNEIISTQTVTPGTVLIAPETPEKTGYKFIGWKVADIVDDEIVLAENFFNLVAVSNNASFDTTEGKDLPEVILMAIFEEVHYVYFVDDQGRVVATKSDVTGETVSTEDVTFVTDVDKAISGWYTDEACSNGNKVDSVVLEESDITLYAKVDSGKRISFETLGGSYVASQFYLPNVAIGTAAPETTKLGYNFEGWFTEYDAETETWSNPFAYENQALTESVTLYAKWTAKTDVPYTVIVWQQKVTDEVGAADSDKAYDYLTSETRYGKTGAAVNADSVTYTYNGFMKNEAKSDNLTIAADGTTVLNIYYDRAVVTVNFLLYETGHVHQDSCYTWTCTRNHTHSTLKGCSRKLTCGQSETGKSWVIKKSVQGLYGADFKEGDWGIPGSYFYTSYNNGDTAGSGCVLLTSYDVTTAGYGDNKNNAKNYGVVTTCNFYGEKKDTTSTIYYYNEQYDGTFKLAETVKRGGGTLTIHEKFTGYVLYKYAVGSQKGDPTEASFWTDKNNCKDGDQSSNSVIYIASKLVSHNIYYANVSAYDIASGTRTFEDAKTAHAETVKFTTPLKGYDEKFVPVKPACLPEGFEFTGWYSDRDLTVKYDFENSTMPNTNLIVYAGWKTPEVEAKYFDDITVGAAGHELTVTYGGKIQESALPKLTKDGYDLTGWATRNGSEGNYTYVPYDFESQVFSNIELYPMFVSTSKFMVTYDVNGGSGNAPVDSRKYAQNSYASVKSASSVVAPENKVFLYWNTAADGSGDKYYPSTALKIGESNVTLYAIYGNIAADVNLTYNANGGSGTDYVVGSIRNNTAVQAAAVTKAGFTRTGYTFTNWNTKADGTGTSYIPSAWVRVTDQGENVLYAQWKINNYEYTVNYVDEDDNVLSAQKTAEATFASTVKAEDEVIAITGYDFKEASVESITIDADATKNVITLVYSINDYEYTVNYVDEDDNVLSAQKTAEATFASTVKAEDEVIAITGYDFKEASVESIAIDADATKNVITLVYSINDYEYTVNYVDEDDNVLSAQKTAEATFASTVKAEDEVIAITGYDFKEASVESITISADATENVITLVYSINDYKYTVNYVDEDDNVLSAQKTAEATFASTVKAEDEVIAITGYDFKEASVESITISADATENVITLVYTANYGTEYTVEHYLQNLDGSYPEEAELTESLTGMAGTMTKAAAKEFEGFKAAAFEQDVIAEDGSTVICIYYERQAYTVTYLVDGEQYGEIDTHLAGETVEYRANPAKVGYTFSGWTRARANSFVMPAENVVIEGTFTVNVHKIIVVVDDEIVDEIEVEYGDDVPEIDTPEEDGYTFSGWDKELPETMPDEDITISGNLVKKPAPQPQPQRPEQEVQGEHTDEPTNTTPDNPPVKPNTGDNSQPMLWMAIMIASMIGVIRAYSASKKRDEE